MPRYRKSIWSGDVLEIQEYFSPRQRNKTYQRSLKENLSSEEQKKHNFKMARAKLTRLINTNFTQGDLFITLTHKEKVSEEDAKRELRNFCNRLRRFSKKKTTDPLKYIYVTEDSKRTHHHMLVNKMECTLQELTALWGNGRVLISIIEAGSDYTGLAHYITKEPKDKKKGKSWSSSRNLKQPKIVVKELKSNRKPKLPKNYKVIEELTYFSEFSGYTRYLKAIRIGGMDYGQAGLAGE